LDVRHALASDADAEAVFRLLGRFATSYKPARPAFDSNYPRLLEKDGVDLLVAGLHGRVVGYILASDSLTLFANGVVTELVELYVEEEERGRGIGRELVRQAVARARDRGAVEVTVPTRRARSFYLALGFELTAELFKLNLQQESAGTP
jgi:ribosomal protein S18 acetylase RimI-like enzyme